MLAEPAPVVRSADMDRIFEAAWGAPPPVVVTIPPNGWSRAPYPLAAVPVGLELVSGARYALIVKEVDGMAAHGASGAVTIVYADKTPRGWSPVPGPDRTPLWRELAWNGENGGARITFQTLREPGRDPLLLMGGDETFQGDRTNEFQVIRLGHDKPVRIGVVPMFEDNADGSESHLVHYEGHIVPATAPAVLAVRYTGWTAASAKAARRPFQATAQFIIRGGCLVPTEPLKLPGVTWTSTVGADCAAKP